MNKIEVILWILSIAFTGLGVLVLGHNVWLVKQNVVDKKQTESIIPIAAGVFLAIGFAFCPILIVKKILLVRFYNRSRLCSLCVVCIFWYNKVHREGFSRKKRGAKITE